MRSTFTRLTILNKTNNGTQYQIRWPLHLERKFSNDYRCRGGWIKVGYFWSYRRCTFLGRSPVMLDGHVPLLADYFEETKIIDQVPLLADFARHGHFWYTDTPE